MQRSQVELIYYSTNVKEEKVYGEEWIRFLNIRSHQNRNKLMRTVLPWSPEKLEAVLEGVIKSEIN